MREETISMRLAVLCVQIFGWLGKKVIEDGLFPRSRNKLVQAL